MVRFKLGLSFVKSHKSRFELCEVNLKFKILYLRMEITTGITETSLLLLGSCVGRRCLKLNESQNILTKSKRIVIF